MDTVVVECKMFPIVSLNTVWNIMELLGGGALLKEVNPWGWSWGFLATHPIPLSTIPAS